LIDSISMTRYNVDHVIQYLNYVNKTGEK
jgi:hypothetical protein